MARTKKSIAEEWKILTFSDMKGVSERSSKELKKVLDYEKKLRKTDLKAETEINLRKLKRS